MGVPVTGLALLRKLIQAKSLKKGVGFYFDQQHAISRCCRQPYYTDDISIDSRICGYRQLYLERF